MKKSSLAALCLLLLSVCVYAAEKVNFTAFVSPTCIHCKHFENEYLPVLQEKYKDTVDFHIYDISKDGNNLVLQKTAKAFGKRPAYPTVIVGDTYMVGYPHEIKTYAESAIERARLLGSETKIESAQEDVHTAFSKITFWAIIGAGLVDGINPCAFAVIVFFVSFITVYKYSRKEILVVGSAYCIAVFIAYILIGLGLFFLAVYDFWVYRKTGRAEKTLLQLPQNLKVRIHKIMHFFLRDKQDNVWRLTWAALAVGFCVSLVEAVCTGQVYLPTVVLIMQDPAFRIKALIYLVLYNIMFIIPLVTVFGLALAGYESQTFNIFLKKHLGLTKLLLCLVFLGLFILLLGNI